MSTVTLAFYKGKGRFFDKIIRWFTNSKYSHSEIIIGTEMWSSTSYRNNTGGASVRYAHHWVSNDKWDYFEVPTEKPINKELMDSLVGARYDWTGIILSQLIPIGTHDGQLWFCSESNALVLKDAGTKMAITDPQYYSPEDLLQHIVSSGAIQVYPK